MRCSWSSLPSGVGGTGVCGVSLAGRSASGWRRGRRGGRDGDAAEGASLGDELLELRADAREKGARASASRPRWRAWPLPTSRSCRASSRPRAGSDKSARPVSVETMARSDALDVAAFEERLDDGGARRGRADAVGLGEDLLDGRVAHELRHAAHRRDERRVVEGLGRRGALVRDGDVERGDGVAEPKRRQGRGRRPSPAPPPSVTVGRESSSVGALRERLPAEGKHLPPGGGEAFAGDLELDLRVCEKLVRRVELRQVPAANELVDGALGGRQRARARAPAPGVGMMRVVRGDLRVVPGPRPQGEVGLARSPQPKAGACLPTAASTSRACARCPSGKYAQSERG